MIADVRSDVQRDTGGESLPERRKYVLEQEFKQEVFVPSMGDYLITYVIPGDTRYLRKAEPPAPVAQDSHTAGTQKSRQI